MSSDGNKIEGIYGVPELCMAARDAVCGHLLGCLKKKRKKNSLSSMKLGRNVNKRRCVGTQQQPGTSELPEKYLPGEKEHMGFMEQLVL